MSFYSHFRKKSIPEWREYYVSYKIFKQIFKPFKNMSKVYGEMIEAKMNLMNQPYSVDCSDMIIEEISHLKTFEDKFIALVNLEIEKIDNFFQLKFLEFQEEWGKIQENTEIFRQYRFEKAYYEKSKHLKNVYFMFYMKVNYLIQFINLNYDAFARLLRKHRKLTKNFSKMMKVSDLKVNELFKNHYINQNSEGLIQMRDEVTTNFLELFYHRYNKDRGVKELKFLLKTRIISIWHSYFLFFYLGCTLAFLIFIICMAVDGSIDPDDDETFKYIFPMFRGSAFIVIYIWFLGWNVYGWTRYHINYKKIFNFNYHASTPTEILMRGMFFSSVLLIIFMWYVVVNQNMGKLSDGLKSLRIPKEFLPMIIWVLLIVYLFFPTKRFNGVGRKYFFERLYRFIISPLVLIDSPSAWVADQMLSFVIPLQDFAYTLCYYISRFQDYDDIHPKYCFSNTLYVGFLVPFFLVLYRIIHFVQYIYLDRKNIRKKKQEIKKIKKKGIKQLKKPDFQMKKPAEKIEEKIKETLPLPTIEENPKTILPIINENPSQISNIQSNSLLISSIDDSRSLASSKPDKNSSKNKDSQKEELERQKNELIAKKNKELATLKATMKLNIMYFICLIIVLLVTIFSFLYAQFPESYEFLIGWVICAFALSTYAYYLDITKDWALFQKNKKHPYLREKLGYQKRSFYYLAIIFDFFLRFVWVFAISPGTSSKLMRPELFIFFMGGFEMFRRAIWNFMIVEKIFITNLESYKCLYEYELPFSIEEVEKYKEDKFGEIAPERKNMSVFQSSGSEDEFKFRFMRKRKKSDELKKSLLEEAQNVLSFREERREDDENLYKSVSEKLQENLNKGKEQFESFLSIESEVKSFKENLQKHYEKKKQTKDKGAFELILERFKKNKKN